MWRCGSIRRVCCRSVGHGGAAALRVSTASFVAGALDTVFLWCWVPTASLRQERWTRWCCGVEGLYGEFAAGAVDTMVLWRSRSLRRVCSRSSAHGGLVALGPYGEFVAELWIQWSCGVDGLYGEFAAEALHTVVLWCLVPTASLRQERWTQWCYGVEGLYGEFAVGAVDTVVLWR